MLLGISEYTYMPFMDWNIAMYAQLIHCKNQLVFNHRTVTLVAD